MINIKNHSAIISTRVQNPWGSCLDLNWSNTLRKGMNTTILLLAMGK